jgi:NAD(P)H-dependent flavin oxidoreductase YrpB (nitropropane dioxygenase family)
MLKTRITELLGIQYPIQCGTMQWLSRAELVSAVANAGGLACLPAATFPTKEGLIDEIHKTQDMTDKPFGVNVSLFPALLPRPPEEMVETVIESGVKILETAGRNPEPIRNMIVENGLIHIHKCARVRDAVKVDRMGVNIISIVGTECGGHPSMEKVTSLVLIPQAVDAVKNPLIVGGGFCDGRTLVVALALGADGVNMGTRFISTKECPAHDSFKQKIVESGEADTVLVMESLQNPARVLRNPWAEKVIEMENKGASLEELVPFISGKVSSTGWATGNIDEGLYPSGQVAGRIHDIPTVSDLMKRIVDEAQEVKERLNKII